MPMQFDPEWLEALRPLMGAFATLKKPALHDIETIRQNVNFVVPYAYATWTEPADLGIAQEYGTYTSFDGASIKTLRLHKPQQDGEEKPPPSGAVLYLYGGGFVAGVMEHYRKWAGLLAAETGMPVFMVEYRQAPEHPHPYPAEDAYAGLKFLQENAGEFNIDPARIALFGESAGSGLCAAIALMARDRSLNPPPAKQVLVFPALDDRNTVPDPTFGPFADSGGWSYTSNLTAWSALLGGEDKVGGPDVSPYAAPARAESLEGLPDAYLDVGQLDIFRDEVMAYASRLAKAGVGVEFHLYPGVPHGFYAMAPQTSMGKRAKDNWIRVLKSV